MDTLTQSVPGSVPSGAYVYTVHVAAGFAVSVTRASFPVGKAASRRPVQAEAALEAPDAFVLSTPVPHPFHGATRLMLSVPAAQRVRAAVCDALGREVAVLLSGEVGVGVHTLTLDGRALPAGLYVVRVEGEYGGTSRTVVRR